MSGTVAHEGEINSIVREYLRLGGFNDTANAFDKDCIERGIPIASNDLHNDSDDNTSYLTEFMKFFKKGDDEKFFVLWMERISEDIRLQDSVAQKLEFYLNIYFAIFPLKHDIKSNADKMQKLQRYLSTKGETLSKAPELSAFFALPYVPDPKNHAQFKDLFADKWSQSLELRVEKFCKSALQSSPSPRIFHIYNLSISANKAIENLTQEIYLVKQRLTNSNKLFNKTKIDYNNLLDVTAHIIDTLEQTVQGVPITPDYIQKIYEKLFSNQLRQTTDFTRPGTASKTLRESLAIESFSKNTVEKMNYKLLKQDLINTNDRQKSFLLQALRWKLSKSGLASSDILDDFIANDIFGCNGEEDIKKATINNLTCDNLIIRLYTVVLFNLISSFYRGRNYLMQNGNIIATLVERVVVGKGELSEREHMISLLQKLSLCGSMQLLMIERNVIEFCVRSLSDIDDLTENTVDYTLALLMNLSLRTTGKKHCVQISDEIITTLSNLMKRDHLELESQGYINGTLYALCTLQTLREKARKMGMVEILKSILKPEKGEMNTQIEYLIRSINSNDYKLEESSDHEDDTEDYDVDSLEKLDLMMDDEMLRPRQGELAGDAFLKKYVVAMPASADNVLKRQMTSENIHIRPATPRKSMVFAESTMKNYENDNKTQRDNIKSTKFNENTTSQKTINSANSTKSNQPNNKPKASAKVSDEAFEPRPRVMRSPEPQARPPQQKHQSRTTPVLRNSQVSPTTSFIETTRNK